MDTSIILIAPATFAAGAAAVMVWREWRSRNRQMDTIAADIEQIKRDAEQSKRDADTAKAEANAKRHTINTVSGIMDATAVVIDIMAQLDAQQIEIDATKARANQALKIMNTMMDGPRAYDPEREAGPRPTGTPRRG